MQQEILDQIRTIKVKGLFVILFLFGSAGMVGQNRQIEQLKKQLHEVRVDTARIELLGKLSNEYLNRYPDSALFYIDSLRLIAKYYNHEPARSIALMHKGSYLLYTGDYAAAAEHILASLPYYLKTHDSVGVAQAYSNLSGIDYYMKDYRSSLDNSLRLRQYINKDRDLEMYSRFLVNTGELYRNLKELDSAQVYARRTLKLAVDNNKDRLLALGRFSQGAIDYERGEYDRALLPLRQALGEPTIPLQFRVSAKAHLAGSLINLNKLAEAEKVLEGLEEDAVTTQDKSVILLVYDFKKQFYVASNDYREAIVYADKYKILSEEIKDLDHTLIRQNLKIKFENFERENENELLRNKSELNNYKIAGQRKIIWGVGTFVFVLLAFLVILYRLYYAKQNFNKALIAQQHILNLNNENLEQINTQKNNLFSIVAHDVKSPVSAIVTSLNMLKDNRETFDEREMEELTTELAQQAEGLHTLLEGVLTWARSQMDGYHFHPVDVDVVAFAKKMIRAEETLIQDKQLLASVEVPSGFLIHVDHQVLEVILRNFLTNAIKFTPLGGRIIFRSKSMENHTTISISDTGMGISPQQIDQIFVRKERFTRRGTNDESGNGIGLILCNEIAGVMGGSIYVESVVGEGSTFSLVMPRKPFD